MFSSFTRGTSNYKSIQNLLLIFCVLFFSRTLLAAPATVTFQARIVRPDLTNLESSNVSFKFYYLYPKPVGTDLQCVIYAEEITGVNMTGSKGLVTLQLGSGTRTYGSGNLKNVFDNSTPSYACQAGGTYTPAATDNRRIIVQFNDGTGVQTLPPSDLSAVPYAMQSYNSQRLGNSLATDFLKFTDFTGTCGAGEYLKYDSSASPKFSCAIPTGTGAGIVMSVAPGTGPLLVGGTAADPTISIPQASASADGYLSSADFTTFNSKLSNFTSLTSGDITGKLGFTPAANNDSRLTDTRTPTDGSVTAAKIATATITFDKFNQSSATTGQVIKWNGSAWVASSDDTGVGSVTSVAGRTGVVTLSSGDISGLAFGTTAGSYAQGNDSRFTDTRTPTDNSVTSAKILDGTIAASDLSSMDASVGQVMKWNGSAWVASSDVSSGGSVTTVTASGPLLSSGGSAPNITLAKATAGVDGYLSSADFTIFAAKLSDFSTLLSSDITGKLGYTPVNPATAVTSVAGRTGVVTLSSGDVSGLAFGTTAGTYAQGNDSRFSDQRNPINDSVTSAKILDGTIVSADISTGAITFDKLNQASASTGQVIKWNGSAWVASSDDTGAGGTVTNVSASGPLSSTGGGTPNITIAKANGSTDGYLSSADFTTFATKLSDFSTLLSSDITGKLGYTPVNPSTLGTAALLNTNQVVLVSSMPASCSAGQTLTFSSPTGSWVCSNIVLGSSTVTSAMISSLDWTKVVNTPTTAAGYGIAKATAGVDGYLSSADFTTFAAKLSDFSTLLSSDITSKLGYTPVNPATAVTSVAGRTGVVTLSSGDISGLAFGTTAGTYAQGNDSRFTDERTPANASVTAVKLESGNNGELFIGNGTGFTKAPLTGTTDQVNVTNGSGTITLSTPQSIATSSSPSFTGLTVSGITGNTLLRANGSGVLANATSADVTGLLGFTPANETSAWSLNASGDVSRTTGNVGIGTDSPVTKLDVAGAVRVGTDSTACTSTNAGAIRLNSTSSLVETCNGSSWEASQAMNSVPPNTVLLMQTCPSGWTDNGAVDTGPASGICGGPTGSNCQMCQSPASDALIPAGSNLLFESCPARWTNLGVTHGPGSAGLNVRYTSCESPTGGSGLPTNSRIFAASCPANWNDIGFAPTGNQLSVTCSGVACRVCEVGSGSVKVSQLVGAPATATSNGGEVGMYAANGGSTSGMGGALALRAGSATTEGSGGAVSISAGSPATATSANYSGSTVTISATSGLGASNGGRVTIAAGNAGSTAAAGNAGYISLLPGLDNAFGYGGVSIGSLTPTAALHIRAGSANVSGAPLKFTSGPVLTTPEPGAIEYDGTNLYYTDSGSTRRTLSTATAGGNLSAGDGSASTPSLSFTSDPDTGFYSSGANNISLATGGTERVRVNSSGSVGIGVTNPSAKLDVAGDIIVRGPSWSSSGDKAKLQLGTTGYDYIEAELNGPMKIMSAQPITFGHDLNGGEQIRISNLGYLGIGTNNPGVKLHTLSNAEAVRTEAATGTSHVYTSIRNGTGRMTIGVEGSTPGTMVSGDTAYAGFISATAGSSLVLATGDTARMTIVGTGTTNGNIGIGLSAPTAKMAIASSDGTVSTAPLKLTAGTNLTTPEAGAIEFDGTSLFYTDSGATRRTIATTTSPWTAVTTNTTVAVGAKVLVDTSGGVVTITLPASPVLGDEVHIIDAAGSFATNNLTVARNGNRIMGLTEDMTVSTNNTSFTLVYYNATNGWRLK